MEFKDVKKVISEKLGWTVRDVFYVCKDMDMLAYYIVYRNHRIRCICAIDELNGCVTGLWE